MLKKEKRRQEMREDDKGKPENRWEKEKKTRRYMKDKYNRQNKKRRKGGNERKYEIKLYG